MPTGTGSKISAMLGCWVLGVAYALWFGSSGSLGGAGAPQPPVDPKKGPVLAPQPPAVVPAKGEAQKITIRYDGVAVYRRDKTGDNFEMLIVSNNNSRLMASLSDGERTLVGGLIAVGEKCSPNSTLFLTPGPRMMGGCDNMGGCIGGADASGPSLRRTAAS